LIAYVDSSVLLRRILGQAGALREWKELEAPIASALVEVECLHTLDRLRLADGIEDRRVSEWREAVYRLLAEAEVVEVTRSALARAAQPMPTSLGTLDAIHLASALLWRERGVPELVMATHDEALATAARACGFVVVGS
jgi:predicted nucleic acid-binding protein